MTPPTSDVYLSVGDPDTSTALECPLCGFDAVLAFPVTLVTATGVSPCGAARACVRCFDEGGH